MRLNRRIISGVLILIFAFITSTGCGGEKITLRFASDAPDDHIVTSLNEEAAQKIEERTNGRVKVNYYGGSKLGIYESVYVELVRGTIDIAQITVPDTRDPGLAAPYLPYYATSWDEAAVLYDPDSYMSRMFAEIIARTDVRFLGWVLEGFIGTGVAIEPDNVFEPGKPKGIRLRTPESPIFRIPQEDLGYSGVTVSYADVPAVIRTKIVDGWIGGTPNVNYRWIGDGITKMYVNYLHAEATSYVMSEKSLAKLSESDRAIVIEVFEEQSRKSFKYAQANEEEYMQRLSDSGVEVIEFMPEVIQANADFIRNVTWTKLEDVLTKELIDNFRAEVEKLRH